jgi:hypothetical protein
MKANHEDFKREVDRRKITCLIHFTPTINLLSMYEQNKILSRAKLEELNMMKEDILDYVEFTDEIRLDDNNYINLSIQHPNTFLFSRFRDKTRDEPHITWCVLKIDTRNIYHESTLFSVTNAANSHNRRVTQITGDLNKFNMLFAPSVVVVTSYGSRTLTRNGIPDCLTTDEQAEVLVKDEIPLNDIISVCFKDAKDLAAGKAALNNYPTTNFIVESGLFLKRS